MKSLAILAVLGCGSSSVQPKRADDVAATRNTVLAISAHVIVLKSSTQFSDYRDVIAAAHKIAGVVSAEPFVFTEATATSAGADRPIDMTVKGVEPSGVTNAAISPLLEHGTFSLVGAAEAPPPIVIADGVAAALGVKLGSDITLTVKPLSPGWEPADAKPYVFRVAGVIHTGIDQYDHQLGYASRAALQEVEGTGDSPTGVEVRVADPQQSAAIARQLGTALGGAPFEVQDWRELNPWLAK